MGEAPTEGLPMPTRGPGAGRNRGLYVIVTEVLRPIDTTVGRLGPVHLEPGHYAYVGSAARGLEARVRRHFAPPSSKPLHWHIDYLLARAPAIAAVLFTGASGLGAECRLSGAIAGILAVDEPAPGFGASDCRCSTHLHTLASGHRGAPAASTLLAPVVASGSRVLPGSDVRIMRAEAFAIL